jgi:Protein of unknown function (DUF1153)
LEIRYVFGPGGRPLSLSTLPPPGSKHWVARQKAEVVAAVCGGLISLGQACSRYDLSAEEFLSWCRSMDRSGRSVQRATRTGEIRRKRKV